ncbi:UNVERIFIED_CONTAM: Transposon Ty3-G Gag-Pol polyprotein [Sesamum radiatum]|uniref:Transposon Ty3-G Gag-Pol polyprotein n=1 Tax=Sesamum radiatum TaxID=300843 RepID=A0AAW2JJS4_SESRA
MPRQLRKRVAEKNGKKSRRRSLLKTPHRHPRQEAPFPKGRGGTPPGAPNLTNSAISTTTTVTPRAKIPDQRSIQHVPEGVIEVEALEDTPLIQFGRGERSGPSASHNDALVITAVLAMYEVGHIFIDSGSSADILFGEAYDQMQLGDVSLGKVNTSLYGFARAVVHPRGMISLPLTMGAGNTRKTYLEGIDPRVITHHLNINPGVKPVKQKKRHFGPEKDKVIQMEVDKLMVVQLPEWLSNVVLVPKPGGKWRMCIDFRDLNKACSKDFYPLPQIDQLVDSTSGSELLSMMDASQGYHQIMLA